MNSKKGCFENAHLPYLMALHSSSDCLGVAVLDCREPIKSRRSATFQVGRQLSNSLLSCVAEILPIADWAQIGRLAVATGPGGFTGTRLTVVMARTLAQQLGCYLDGVSSFALMAPRLVLELPENQRKQPFWIVQPLPRRGVIGGCYQMKEPFGSSCRHEVLELETPHLLEEGCEVSPALNALDDVSTDVESLLERCFLAHRSAQRAHWSATLPIYPTSPVGKN